jgi:hypothetical protein
MPAVLYLATVILFAVKRRKAATQPQHGSPQMGSPGDVGGAAVSDV